MNYFIEGLQGSGKTTFAAKLSDRLAGHVLFTEGSYSPVELAWCAYMDESEYLAEAVKFPGLRKEIEENTFDEDGRKVVCYTRVKTGDSSFYKTFEQYEIYNGRVSYDRFREILLKRYARWNGDDMIFECSLFQNTIEDMILFRCASDGEIMELYREVSKALEGKQFRIVYLKTRDIRESIGVIRRERTDGSGNEVWFDMMLGFFNDSPFAKANGVSGEDALYEHFAHRQELELRICSELFPDKTTVICSKGYSDSDTDQIMTNK